MFNKLNRKKSFTLIEILLALAILAVGLVSILSLFAVSVRSAGRILALTRIGLVAQLTMEDIKAYALRSTANFNNLSSGQIPVNSAISSLQGTPYGGLTGLNRALAVLSPNTGDPQDNGLPAVRGVQVTITLAGVQQPQVFVTKVAKFRP